MGTLAPVTGELLPMIGASLFIYPLSRCKRLGKECYFREARSLNTSAPRDRDR